MIGSFTNRFKTSLVKKNTTVEKPLYMVEAVRTFMLQDCNDKTSVLDGDGSQVLSLTTTDSRAGCRLVSSENGSLDISCQGKVNLSNYRQE